MQDVNAADSLLWKGSWGQLGVLRPFPSHLVLYQNLYGKGTHRWGMRTGVSTCTGDVLPVPVCYTSRVARSDSADWPLLSFPGRLCCQGGSTEPMGRAG